MSTDELEELIDELLVKYNTMNIEISLTLFKNLPDNPSLLDRVKLKLELIRIELGVVWYDEEILEANLLKWGLRRRYMQYGIIAVTQALHAPTLTERMAAHVFIIEVLDSQPGC